MHGLLDECVCSPVIEFSLLPVEGFLFIKPDLGKRLPT